MPKYQIENINLFGESTELVTSKDLDKIETNASNRYHLLRHFENVPEKYIKKLVGEKYDYFSLEKGKFETSTITKEDIETALNNNGSKFLPGIPGLETPDELINVTKDQLEKLIKEEVIFWVIRKGRKTAMFSFEYPENVGYSNLVKAEEIGKKIKSTNKICVELNLVDSFKYINITAYPGDLLSPDLPGSDQDFEEYEYNKDFWDKYTFAI